MFVFGPMKGIGMIRILDLVSAVSSISMIALNVISVLKTISLIAMRSLVNVCFLIEKLPPMRTYRATDA